MNDITNSGAYNSGDRNSGHYNSGNYNSGNYNSGNYNSGNYNSGNYNSGTYNSGTYNSGNYNSGNCNSGDYNSGNYNSGNYNSGYFCTSDPPVTFFDERWSGSHAEAVSLIPYLDIPVCCEWVPTESMTESEKSENPNYATIGGYLKSNPLPLIEAFPKAWEAASEETKQGFLSLPNFDAEKFLQITGVDVREVDSEECEVVEVNEITLNGQRYLLVPVDD